jgi:hypothetical protein
MSMSAPPFSVRSESAEMRAGRVWEQLGPWAFGTLAGGLLWYFDPPGLATGRAMDRVLDGSIGAASVLSGFQLTALTLLLSITDRPVVQQLKKLGHYDRLITFHWHAIAALLLWLVASLALLAVEDWNSDVKGDVSGLDRFSRWSSIAYTVIMAAAICTSFRITRLMVKLLRIAVNQAPT